MKSARNLSSPYKIRFNNSLTCESIFDNMLAQLLGCHHGSCNMIELKHVENRNIEILQIIIKFV